ncbi:RDD family protein [Actinoplanes sp. Pm04-4]|uniref:RDD family protein n=1 Tax=Paractinoplanes pyxinae TaxID=2997416 RepID=A0ABT4AU25_9ACTN|nr:RDD family protein [Actinoplanes pyxinae]MCY1136843.1 RDD family protein [Actinoplanes pyxinae]
MSAYAKPAPADPLPAAYGGLVSRLLAYVVDALIVSMLIGVAAAALGLVASVVGYEARELARAVLSGYIVFLPSILALYCALFWLLAGRTPGMAVLGLRVVTTEGRPVRWLAALVRALLLAYFPVGALWLLVNRRHQGIHDLIARTSVVRGP